MKKLLLWDFDDDFAPAEYFDENDPCEECYDCPFFAYGEDGGWCFCSISNGSEQPDEEELKEIGVQKKCPLYDLFND